MDTIMGYIEGISMTQVLKGAGPVVFFLVILLLSKKISHYLIAWILKFVKKHASFSIEELEDIVASTIRSIIIFLGALFSTIIAPLPPTLNAMLIMALKIGAIYLLGSLLYKMEPIFTNMFWKSNGRLNIKTTGVVKQLTSNVIKVTIIAVTFVIIASEFFDISAFIAGLGIAGLAAALAAQDTLGSVVAGFSIMLDRPFDIGDWILCNGNEGIVEDLNFRSTKLRTFSNELIVVPNTIIAGNPITNFSKRGSRRVKFNLGLVYSTKADQVKLAVEEITKILSENAHVDPSNITVRFNSFGDSSLDIFISYHLLTTEYAKYMALKEDNNLAVMEKLDELGIGVAFPSTSIYFENELKTIQI